MKSEKNSKSCCIIYRIRSTLDIKYKRLIYYSLIHPYTWLTVWTSGRLHIELIRYCTKEIWYCTKEIRACTVCYRAATAIEGYFLKSKNLPLAKFINQQEGILAYKVINGTYWLGDILTDRHELDHNQLRNDENLRISLHSTTHSQLFIAVANSARTDIFCAVKILKLALVMLI